jgi:murein DD-endopeptidase MepM/ murein hydrolase activator NlpD
MTNILSPITQLNQLAGKSSPSSQSGNLSDISKSFSDILSATLLNSSQNSSAGGSGADTTSMLLPLMLTLLERLLEQQVKTDTAPAEASAAKATVAEAAPKTAVAAVPKSSAEVVSGDSPSGRPVGGVVTNTFHPGHNGIDFGVPIGTQVKATMSGKVVYAGWNNQGYGNLVIVENGPYRTYFAHLSKVPVQLGEDVSAGSIVGISGSTGNSTGPHVHYEVRRNQAVIDPTSFTL